LLQLLQIGDIWRASFEKTLESRLLPPRAWAMGCLSLSICKRHDACCTGYGEKIWSVLPAITPEVRDWTDMKTQSIFSCGRLSASVAPMVLGLAIISTPAFAQTAPASAEEEAAADEGEITVTGSRIARPNLDSNSPISVVTPEVFQTKGAVNVERVLNDIPQVSPGLTANTNNGGDGTVTVDLRGLGPTRTLVLINGRRFVPATNTGRVDLNNIPANLIKRVDVVTGGASAVYGSDALSGVVNFILKDDFEGVEVGAQYGVSEQGDGSEKSGYVTFGANLNEGRGNVTASIAYFDRNPIFQSARSRFAVDINTGSATGVAGRLDGVRVGPSNGNAAFNADGSLRPFNNAGSVAALATGATDRFNFAPANLLQTPLERLTFSVLGNYDITDSIEAYFDGFFTDSRTRLVLAPTPLTDSNPFVPIRVSPTNPALSAATRAQLLALGITNPIPFRRRITEAGPRINLINNKVFQGDFGVRGDVFGDFKYDLYYTYGRTEQASELRGDLSRSRIGQNLAGCLPGSYAGCTPINFFGPGTLTPAALSQVLIRSSTDNFVFERNLFAGSLSGSIVELPAGPLGVAIGAEYRKDRSSFVPSEAAQSGDLTGFNAVLPTAGSFDVKEIYGELLVPLFKDKPFAKTLELELGGRYSDYSTIGSVYTYKAGGRWAPVQDLTIRGLYQRATRAPSVFELFQAGDQGFPVVTDPCNNVAATNARLTAICIASGVANPATFQANNSQIQSNNTGNPNLKEEKSTTYTVGVLIQPRFAKRVTLSVDYFNIKIDGAISRIGGGASGLVANCFAQTITTAAAFRANPICGLLSRPAGDLLANIPLVNGDGDLIPGAGQNKLQTSGIDVSLSSSYDIGNVKIGTLSTLTWIDKYRFNGQEFVKLLSGDFGNIPEFRSNFRLTFDIDDIGLSLNWQRIHKLTEEFSGQKVKAANYFDLGANVKASDKFTFFGGVNNLLDRKIQQIPNQISNSDVNTYDPIGRRFFFGIKGTF
jgi:iron complex outermembrane recepter protein